MLIKISINHKNNNQKLITVTQACIKNHYETNGNTNSTGTWQKCFFGLCKKLNQKLTPANTFANYPSV